MLFLFSYVFWKLDAHEQKHDVTCSSLDFFVYLEMTNALRMAVSVRTVTAAVGHVIHTLWADAQQLTSLYNNLCVWIAKESTEEDFP